MSPAAASDKNQTKSSMFKSDYKGSAANRSASKGPVS